ncbi:MAG: hypothetical protein ACJ8CB_28440, partial [Ktedonobacteraceae bacterium]
IFLYTEYAIDFSTCQVLLATYRHLEIRPPVSGLERCPVCHPERSEGSGEPDAEILSAAKDDRPYLQMSMLHRQGFSKVAFMQRLCLCMLLFCSFCALCLLCEKAQCAETAKEKHAEALPLHERDL